MLFQVGDIVSVTDEDGSIYYAQIRGLLQDQYCEKSAGLTWLLPTQSSPPPEKEFDPLTYILGNNTILNLLDDTTCNGVHLIQVLKKNYLVNSTT